MDSRLVSGSMDILAYRLVSALSMDDAISLNLTLSLSVFFTSGDLLVYLSFKED